MMELFGIIAGVVAAWFGSLEWRIRSLRKESEGHMDAAQVEHLINLKIEILQYMQKEIREDVKVLHKKLDKLLDK